MCAAQINKRIYEVQAVVTFPRKVCLVWTSVTYPEMILHF
jgi:hypothetical protein